MIQIKTFPNGGHTVIEADKIRHFWTVKCYRPDGELHDKIRCDDYRNALDYLRAFKQIAKNF
jgi:hypothetical protein